MKGREKEMRIEDGGSRMEDGTLTRHTSDVRGPDSSSPSSIFLETREGRPHRVRLRGRWLPVLDVVDAWVIQGRWWSREERRLYARLRTPAGTFDLCHREGRWELAAVVD